MLTDSLYSVKANSGSAFLKEKDIVTVWLVKVILATFRKCGCEIEELYIRAEQGGEGPPWQCC